MVRAVNGCAPTISGTGVAAGNVQQTSAGVIAVTSGAK